MVFFSCSFEVTKLSHLLRTLGLCTKKTLMLNKSIYKQKSLFNGLLPPFFHTQFSHRYPLAFPCFFSDIFYLFSILSWEEKFCQHFQQLFCASFDSAGSLKIMFLVKTSVSLQLFYKSNYSKVRNLFKNTYCQLLVIYSILMCLPMYSILFLTLDIFASQSPIHTASC